MDRNRGVNQPESDTASDGQGAADQARQKAGEAFDQAQQKAGQSLARWSSRPDRGWKAKRSEPLNR